MENKELQIIETSSIEVIEAGQRAEYDIQIATAKKYPRDLQRVQSNCITIVSMNKETAATCRYTLPRGGKKLDGPTVHMARIIAQQYGNIRVDARIKQITDKQIISEAVCFDLETNYACKVEVRRSIVGHNGRFNDDMITVTGNAANAIAFRNAVFNVVPKSITNNVYKAAMNTITGDLTDGQKLLTVRKKWLDYFKSNYGVDEKHLLEAMMLNSVNQIKSDQIADLVAMDQSLKDGDSTVKEMFFPEEKKAEKVSKKKAEMKVKKEEKKDQATHQNLEMP